MFLDEPCIEAPLPVTGNGKVHVAVLGDDVLAAVAVAVVAAGLLFICIEMMVRLSIQNPLC